MTVSSQRLYIPFQQVFTNLGAIGAGWKIYTYLTNTSTPKATYSDTALTVPNTNPIVADSAGRLPNIYGSSATLYKFVLTDENDVVIETRDPVDPQMFTLTSFNPQPASFWGVTEGTSTAYTLTSTPNIADIGYQNNQVFLIEFNVTRGASPTLNIDGLGDLNLKQYLSNGTKVGLVAGKVKGGERYWATNDGTDIVIFVPTNNLIGEIISYPNSTSIPADYLHLDGSVVLISDIPLLEPVIYCGNANNATADYYYKCSNPANPNGTRTTSGNYIVLLDTSGRFARGWKSGQTIDSGRAFNSYQDHAAELHRHSQGEGQIIETPNNVYGVTGKTINGVTYGTANATSAIQVTGYSSSVQLPSTTSGTVNVATENRPTNYTEIKIIKYQ